MLGGKEGAYRFIESLIALSNGMVLSDGSVCGTGLGAGIRVVKWVC